MSKKKKGVGSLVPRGATGLQVVQELKIGTQDITYIGVARHEKHLINTGNIISQRMTAADAALLAMKTELHTGLVARAKEVFGDRLYSLEHSLRDLGFDIKETKVDVSGQVDALLDKNDDVKLGDKPTEPQEVEVSLSIVENSGRYSDTTFASKRTMPLSPTDKARLKRCARHVAYIQRLTAAANQVRKARQEMQTYERQLAASLAEASLRGSESGRDALRIIEAMPQFTLGVDIEAPAIEATAADA